MPILHSVYFYTHEQVSDETIQQQKRAILEELSTIPVVRNVMAGSPAGVNRDVVDNSYAMSLHLITDDLKTLSTYQNHPVHVAFVNKHKATWKQVKVFDTLI